MRSILTQFSQIRNIILVTCPNYILTLATSFYGKN